MDPVTLIGIAATLVTQIVIAIGRWGPELWDKPLREIIPDKLRVQLEREVADAAAAAKFGAAPPPQPFVDDVE